MISEQLATALQAAGLHWKPAAGDRFVIPVEGLDGELFTLSEMTIEAREYATGTILGFNGTTEWALDSVAKDDALWMPREDQLRSLLGATFVALRRHDDGTWVVTTRSSGGEVSEVAADRPEDAYGNALLALLELAVEDVER